MENIKSIWHDSLVEQPDKASDVVIWDGKNAEIINNCIKVNKGRLWAYVNDLLYMKSDSNKVSGRQEYNLKCLDVIKEMIMNNPDLRFCQILNILGLDHDRFYEEPKKTYESIKGTVDEMAHSHCTKDVSKDSIDINHEIDKRFDKVTDKLTAIYGKLSDIYEEISKPFQFPYRDYTPPSPVPGMDVWYKTHGVDKVPPVTCNELDDEHPNQEIVTNTFDEMI